MLRQYHRGDAEGGGRAQDRADIVRVADPVEDHHDRAPGAHLGRPQHIVEIGRVERLRLQCPALMHGALRQQRIQGGAVKHLDRLGGCRRYAALGAGGGDHRGSLLRLAGEHRQPPPPALRVGQRRGDRMPAVEPTLAPVAARRRASSETLGRSFGRRDRPRAGRLVRRHRPAAGGRAVSALI